MENILSFLNIFDLVGQAVSRHKNIKNPGIFDILYCTEMAVNDINRHFI